MPSDWMQKQTHSKKKTRWIVIVILVLVVLAAAGGATAGVLLSKKKSSGASATANGAGGVTSGGGGGLTGPQDVAKNGDLNKDSPEIKALMSNSRLHKVFHGMDYTPLNSQYPDCELLFLVNETKKTSSSSSSSSLLPLPPPNHT